MVIVAARRTFERSTLSELCRLEWLEVDGRGGFTSGTAAGLPTRRQHGVLLVARKPPHERMMLVNHLREWVGTQSRGDLFLSTSGRPEEDGWRRCTSFSLRPHPRWTFVLDGQQVERTIVRVRGTDRVIVSWRLLHATDEVRLHVRPMLTGRAAGDVYREIAGLDTAAKVEPGMVSWLPHADCPRIYARWRGEYRHAPEWQRKVRYLIDQERGEPSKEDWWSPGVLSVSLAPGETVSLALSTDPFAARAAREEGGSPHAPEEPEGPVRSRLFQALSSAADAYTVEVDDRAAVLAGFPWFDVWTRDTFTAFTGLFLATGRFALARKVLATFAPLVRRGMLPSNLPGGDVTPEYHAADASFWFVLCVARYIERSGDRDALDAFAWSAVRAIVDGHIRGEPACVRVDDDGLLTASSAEGPLTWMDAVFDGRVMTPRRGKPVELQALWLHALRVADDLGRASGDHAFAEQCRSLRDRGVSAFRRRFWCAERGYLYDVVDGPDGDDATLRPNQVFALALDSELLPRDQALHVLDVLHDRLLAPYGLRTLAADDPAYHPYYCGDRSRRDPAYHQGTVWPFLLGPFLSAWIHLRGSEPLARERAGAMLTALEEAIDTSGCMGHLAEIFDGTAPHEPRGCFAQAWSVGELLSAMRDCGL